MNYNLTPGISLDDRTIYFSIPNDTTISEFKKIAQTESSDNYIAEDIVDEVSRGYYHYLDKDDNEVIGIFYSSDGTNLANIKLPEDFGTILTIDDTSELYEYISRTSHEKVYVHSEDFDKRESLDKDTILATIEDTVSGFGVPMDSVLGFDGEIPDVPNGYEIIDNPYVESTAEVKNVYTESTEAVYSCYYVNQVVGDFTAALDLLNGEVI